jgi:hypothetical protein
MDSSHCEAAHLCSQGIRVHVLVPPSNFETLKKKYASIPKAENHITVQELYLQDKYFNTERIKRLMAFGDDGEHPPLYLQVNNVFLKLFVVLIFGLDEFENIKEHGFEVERGLQLQVLCF